MSTNQPPKPVGITPGSGHQHSYDQTQTARRIQNNTQFSSRTGTAAYGAQLQAVADPNTKLAGFKQGFQDTGRLCTGWIVDGTSIANCYKVFVEKSRAPIIAAALSGTSHVCFGASSVNTYAPGTSVILMVHDKVGQAYILGSVPNVLDVGKRAYHDYISQASRKRVDDCHKKYIKEPMNGQMVDWSSWRPWDATLASEWGAVSTTGIAISIDDFMLKAAVNEFCGLYGFYHDSLLRVAGYNFQLWTAGSERDAYMDQAECNDLQGYSPYPWEAVGLIEPGIPMINEYEPKDYQCALAKPYYSHWENKHEFQQPYHRTQKFFGYLGQGQRSVVHSPPDGLQRFTYKPGSSGSPSPPFESSVKGKDGLSPDCGGGPDKERDYQEKPVKGLHEDNVAMDGRRFISSAKGIVISKRMLLPMPHRIKRPESGDGDDAEKNYKAASKYGSGPDHKITGDIKTTDDTYPNMQRAAALLDMHGYLFNYAGIHPFYWHEKDFKTWEQSELQYADVNHRIPNFGQLKGSMYLKEQTPRKLKIDHRYNTQNFYETECSISLLEDGGVVISDGYGAEIRMSGGCLILSAPGDVWMKSGRHTQAWSGGDCIIRAKEGVDISTTDRNIRIKSEQNVMILAGNDSSEREGGVLIESRANNPIYEFEQCGDDVIFGGIVLRAPKSEVVSIGHRIYMRTGGGGSSIPPGNITIDAGKGEAELVTKSNNIFHYMGEGGRMYHFFRASADEDTVKANMFSKSFTLLAGPLGVDKDIISNGAGLFKKSLLVSKGHILTEAASKGAIFVGPCDEECQGKINEAIDKIRDLVDKELPDIGDQIDEEMLEQLWYGDKRPGNTRLMDIMEFTFRTDEQYKIPDFLLYEDRWQQMARLMGDIPERWTEKPVKSKACEETWPFPGKKWLNEEPAYVEQDFNIVEMAGGGLRDKDRGKAPGLAGEYASPEFKSNDKKIINGYYPIIGR
jgi:hypothetical protein